MPKRYLVQIHDVYGNYFPTDRWCIDAAMPVVEFDDLQEASHAAHERWRASIYGYQHGRSPFSYRVFDRETGKVAHDPKHPPGTYGYTGPIMWQQHAEYWPGVYSAELPE